MSKVTYAEVSDAARRLHESGERPSAPKIRKLIGDRGGMATIQKHLDAWRESDEGAEAEAPVLPEMPERLAGDAQVLIQQIWAQAKAAADAEIQSEREKLASERAEMQEKLAETIAVSEEQESQIDALNDRIEESEKVVSQLRKAAEGADAAVADHKIQVAVLSERCVQHEASIKTAEERESKLLAQLEKLSESIKSARSSNESSKE